MKNLLKTLLCAVAAFSFTSVAIAASDRGSIDDAMSMVKKAKEYMAANGKDKALAEFSNPTGQFKDRDIYVFVYDKTGKNLAHGGNASLVGKDLSDLKDPDGVPITKGLIETAQKGGGKFNYKYMNPVTKQVEKKTGYTEMVGDLIVGSGAYSN